jgi:hypothetical protein
LSRVVLKCDIRKILGISLSHPQTLLAMVPLSTSETCQAIALHDANRIFAGLRSRWAAPPVKALPRVQARTFD